jgi:dolichyl-diphosphooligosaccharide--protein glycosyltransferase
VIAPDGGVYFEASDGAYHARRALYSFVHFPAVLAFDPYIAFPDGAAVPMPPLYDWLLGGLARAFGSSVETFERVAAWVSPVLGSLTVLPVFAIARGVAGVGTGLGAAWIYALVPGAGLLATLGNPDHHAAVALLAALWLASSVAETRRERSRAVHALAYGAVIAAMLLVWSGSLLYLALGEGTRFAVAAVASGRPARLFAQAASAAVAVALVAPWLAATGAAKGPFASTTLSWLHVSALAALAALCLAAGTLARARPEPRPLARALRAALLAAALALPLLALPSVREGLAGGGAFVAKADTWAARNPEQRPLFDATPSRLKRTPLERFGLFAWLVPLVPALVAVRLRADRREPGLVLFAWSSVLAALALQQVRFANDFAVPGAVVFAWTLAGVRDRLALRLPPSAATALALAAGGGMLAPGITGVHLPRIEAALRPEPPARLSARASVRAFGLLVRRVTPETAGFLDPGAQPEWGLLTPPALGHAMVYFARRPVPANSFGPYLDAEKYDAVEAFYAAGDEATGVAIAERLRVRFVLTADAAGLAAPELEHRLHRDDGGASDSGPHLERFRLIAEGPPRGRPLAARFPRGAPPNTIPYKLFELVLGARLEAPAPPGATLRAELELETNLGRRLVYRASATAGADGVARLRVPHPTDGAAPTRALGPWRLALGDARWTARVSEAAVARGEVVRAAPPALPR